MLYGYFEDGEPYLQAVVAIPGFPATTVTFMVDTGSASTILSSQDAKEIGIDVKTLVADPEPAKGAGGPFFLHTVDARILFASEQTQKICNLAIGIPDKDYRISSLLGRDILNVWSMRYRASDSTLEFSVDAAGPDWL